MKNNSFFDFLLKERNYFRWKRNSDFCFDMVLLIMVVDQVTKSFAVSYTQNKRIDVNSVMSLIYSENTGAAWSIFRGHSCFLGFLGIIALLAIAWHCRNLDLGVQKFSLMLISGGILGNTIDRFIRGHVIDFISIDLKFYRWPTFNIADSAICIGAIILLFTFRKKA